MSNNLTRRAAIIAGLMAWAGTPMNSQKTADSNLKSTPLPSGLSIDLDVIEFLEVNLHGKTIHLTANEIWNALQQ